jgi:hypothetical protein
MRHVLSAAAGGLAVGLLALMTIALTGRSVEPSGDARLERLAATAPGSQLPVRCGAWEEAIVERLTDDALRVTCVDRMDAPQANVASLAGSRQEPTVRRVAAERVVYRDAPGRADRATVKPGRPVSKSVLIIAGAAGAGAGAGGLIGGKKGALAGAAIGGGAASIYEAVKR